MSEPKTPKYSDDRYPHGYTKAEHTDIRQTFERVRNAQKAKAASKVQPIRKPR
jgi:hypothetical protein